MSLFRAIQWRILRISLLALAAAQIMRLAMWIGAAEPFAFIFGLMAVIALALAERFWRKNWSKGAAASLAALFGPAIAFPLNDIFPNALTDVLLWLGVGGMICGSFYLLWSIFMRPVATFERSAGING